MSVANLSFVVCGLLAFFLIWVPTPQRHPLGNIGIYCFIFWTASTLLIYVTNALIWNDNTRAPPLGWCDFASHFVFMYLMAIPATSLCIAQRLYVATCGPKIHRDNNHVITENLKILCFDLTISCGIPLLSFCLQFLFRARSRFSVYENVGCVQEVVDTPGAQIAIFLLPILVALGACIYLGLAIRMFLLKDRDLEACRPSGNGPQLAGTGVITLPQFSRHAIFAAAGISYSIPFCIWRIIMNLVHRRFTLSSPRVAESVELGTTYQLISFIPDERWQNTGAVAFSLEMGRWIAVILAVGFFASFAFSQEMKEDYVILWKNLRNLKVKQAQIGMPWKTKINIMPGKSHLVKRNVTSPVPQVRIHKSSSSDSPHQDLPVMMENTLPAVYVSRPIVPPSTLELEAHALSVPRPLGAPPISKPKPLPLLPDNKSSSPTSILTSPSLYSEASAETPKLPHTPEKSFLVLESPGATSVLRDPVKSPF